MASPAPGFETPVLFIESPTERRHIPLPSQRVRLGRSQSNDLAFPDDAGLSREHLIVEREGDNWVLRDVGSRNGTLLNGSRVVQPVILSSGDRIVAGHLAITFLTEGSSRPRGGVDHFG